MLGYLILLFITIPIIELALLIKVGQFLGVLNTVMIVVGTGFLGAVLARSQGMLTIRKLQDRLNRGTIPGDELLDGLFILVGGILLLTPGLITDLVGFLFLIPYSRHLPKAWLKEKFRQMLREGRVTGFSVFGS